jgi:hypothetical protein
MITILRLFVLLGFIVVIPGISSFSQVGINSDKSAPDPSAGLDVKFSDKGFLPPRMTFDERNAIVSPHEGLMVYCTNCNTDGTGLLSIYQGGKWKNILLDCTTPAPPTPGTNIPDTTKITWNWNPAWIASGYKWNTVDDYSSATNVGTSPSHTETGLTVCTTYTRYVWAYNVCGHSNVCILSQATLQIAPSSPIAGTSDATCSQIVFHWSAVPLATGYKAGQNSDYASAFDLGNVLTATAPNCTPSTWYYGYVWAYNDCGHSAPTALSGQTLPGLCIGLDYQGGRIFYLDGTGLHGLIASTSDLGNSFWSPPFSGPVPGTSTAIGTGQANTNAIISIITDPATAAMSCHNYTGGSYSDWFLPSKDELNLLYLQKSFFDGLGGIYWSSSQYDDNTAWTQDLSTGAQNHTTKYDIDHVRAVRAF